MIWHLSIKSHDVFLISLIITLIIIQTNLGFTTMLEAVELSNEVINRLEGSEGQGQEVP